MTALTWTAGNGKEIKITVEEASGGEAVATVFLGGVYQFSSTALPTALRVPTSAGGQTIVSYYCGVGLTQERFDQLSGALIALQAAIDARPEVRMRKLIRQRERLAEDIGYIIDAAHEADVSYVERASANGFAKRSARDYAGEEQAARAALAEFDLEHPEVAIKVATDKAAATARFLATD